MGEFGLGGEPSLAAPRERAGGPGGGPPLPSAALGGAPRRPRQRGELRRGERGDVATVGDELARIERDIRVVERLEPAPRRTVLDGRFRKIDGNVGATIGENYGTNGADDAIDGTAAG